MSEKKEKKKDKLKFNSNQFDSSLEINLNKRVSLNEHVSLSEHVSLNEHVSLSEHVSLNEHVYLNLAGVIFMQDVKYSYDMRQALYHYGSPFDSKTIIYIAICGKAQDCEHFANEYNNHIGSYQKFLESVGGFKYKCFNGISNDFAFRLLAFNFESLFGEYFEQDILSSYNAYNEMRRKVLKNVIVKFFECNQSDYGDICKEFKKCNKNRMGEKMQADPHFCLSWELVGKPHKNPTMATLAQFKPMGKKNVRYFTYPDRLNDEKDFDHGFMVYLYNYLILNPENAVLLQVTAPDFRWIAKTRGQENKAHRYSDIHISITVRGKNHTGESYKATACRELKEELSLNARQCDLSKFHDNFDNFFLLNVKDIQ